MTTTAPETDPPTLRDVISELVEIRAEALRRLAALFLPAAERQVLERIVAGIDRHFAGAEEKAAPPKVVPFNRE